MAGSSTAGALWERLAGLPLTIEEQAYVPLALRVSPEFERRSTIIQLAGAGHSGAGEDVTYAPELHDTDALPQPQVAGEWTLASFSAHIGGLDLFPAPPENPAFRNYRRWAWESAALDLALRQAGTDLPTALGRPARPVRFVSSARIAWPGEEPRPEVLTQLRERVPGLRFKLDADATWDASLLARLAELDVVDAIDFKAYYKGTVVDVEISPQQTLAIAEALPGTTLEDVAPGEATDLIAARFSERLAWDAPIHDWDDVVALPLRARRMNVKPSRIGSIERLLFLYEQLEAEGIETYGGGQFELGPGRGQIILLASIFHPDGANDVAPVAFHDAAPGAELPAPPLQPGSVQGFRWTGDGA